MADYDLTVTDSGAGLDEILGKANTALQPEDVGELVQGYDADTAKLDIAQSWDAKQTFKLFEADAGSLTADAPFVISQIWDNPAVAFTGLKVDITNTASAGGSSPFSIVCSSSALFSVASSGAAVFADASGNKCFMIYPTTVGGIILGSNNCIGFRSSTTVNSGLTDTKLYRDDSGVIAQRNGSNPQAFKIYNAEGNNYERARLAWELGRFVIATSAAGTGTKRGITLDATDLILSSLPTTDPAVAGRIWLDGTALKVSAGV